MMLKKQLIILSSVLVLMTTAANAEDKSQFCPQLNQIHIKLTAPYRYVLYANNSDGKYFVTDEQRYDDSNGPALPVMLNGATYEKPKLTCVYYAFHRYNIHPKLINVGDY